MTLPWIKNETKIKSNSILQAGVWANVQAGRKEKRKRGVVKPSAVTCSGGRDSGGRHSSGSGHHASGPLLTVWLCFFVSRSRTQQVRSEKKTLVQFFCVRVGACIIRVHCSRLSHPAVNTTTTTCQLLSLPQSSYKMNLAAVDNSVEYSVS